MFSIFQFRQSFRQVQSTSRLGQELASRLGQDAHLLTDELMLEVVPTVNRGDKCYSIAAMAVLSRSAAGPGSFLY